MTEHPYITVELALQGLEAAVEERGVGFYYTDLFDKQEFTVCEYVTVPKGGGTAKPACIVGLALAKLGWTTEEIASLPNTRALMLFRDGNVAGTEEAGRVLSAAQYQQDNGFMWGEALGAARRTADELASARS